MAATGSSSSSSSSSLAVLVADLGELWEAAYAVERSPASPAVPQGTGTPWRASYQGAGRARFVCRLAHRGTPIAAVAVARGRSPAADVLLHPFGPNSAARLRLQWRAGVAAVNAVLSAHRQIASARANVAATAKYSTLLKASYRARWAPCSARQACLPAPPPRDHSTCPPEPPETTSFPLLTTEPRVLAKRTRLGKVGLGPPA